MLYKKVRRAIPAIGNRMCKGTEVGTSTAQPVPCTSSDMAGAETVYTGEGDES